MLGKTKSHLRRYKSIMTPRRAVIGTWILLLLLAHLPLVSGQSSGSGGLLTPVCLDFVIVLALAVTPVETLVSVGTDVLHKVTGTEE